MQNKIKASVILPTLRRRETLLYALESLLHEGCWGCEDEFEILIVEQSPYEFSEGEIRQWLKSRPFCRWIRMENANLPNARNVGILQSKGEIVIFVDDDMIFEKGFIQAHICAHEAPNVKAVAGRLVNEKAQSMKRKFWQKHPPFFSLLSGTLYGGFDLSGNTRSIVTVPGGNMSFSKEAIQKAGGFDSNFEKVAFREEAEALERLRKLSCKIVYEPKALAWHLQASEGGERLKDPSDILFWSRRNESFFIARHFPTMVWYGNFLRGILIAATRGLVRFSFFQYISTASRAMLAGKRLADETLLIPASFIPQKLEELNAHEIS